MPETTPRQKITQVNFHGQDLVEVVTIGDTFDDAQEAAWAYAEVEGVSFVHPFNDPMVIQGQATVGLELFKQWDKPADYLIVPIGGGGLSAGIASVLETLSPETKLIGVEPDGAAAMKLAFENGKIIPLENIDPFTDGAAVRRVGSIPFEIIRNRMETIVTVPEGKICDSLLKLYNESAIVAEPAGALSIAALDMLPVDIFGKEVVCVVSGGNNDISRMEDIKERALLYKGLKHYYLINFPQRAGALREFVNDVLGPNDNIVHFEYIKKSSRAIGPALVGIEFISTKDNIPFEKRLNDSGFNPEYLNNNNKLFRYLI